MMALAPRTVQNIPDGSGANSEWGGSVGSVCGWKVTITQPAAARQISVIDGGFVRAHKEGFFEVIAGRSIVAFRRQANDEIP
jgi:hypothetical protein